MQTHFQLLAVTSRGAVAEDYALMAFIRAANGKET